MEENNWKLEDFSGEETKDKRSISSSINVVHSKIVLLLQSRVNNLNIRKRKTAFTHFKVKQRKIHGLVLIDNGNLVHSAIVSRDFWESIGARLTIKWTTG